MIGKGGGVSNGLPHSAAAQVMERDDKLMNCVAAWGGHTS